MHRYLVRRLFQTLLLLLVVSLVTFILISKAPGGPAMLLDPNMSPEDAERMKQIMGLDQPFLVQYWRWLLSTVTGDLGTSYSVRLPVWDLISQALPNTLLLSSAAIVTAVLISIPAGVMSAAYRNSWFDVAITFLSFFGLSVPVFWYGLMMVMLFSVKLGWLPAGGMIDPSGGGLGDILIHLILPTIVLATANMAQLVRYTRSSMISVLQEDFIRTAKAKGLAHRLVLFKHAFRNAMIPVVTVVGLMIPKLVGGAAITETVFDWPGMGKLAVASAFERDYPVIMGVALIVSVVVVLGNFLVDSVYGLIDPRIRYD